MTAKTKTFEVVYTFNHKVVQDKLGDSSQSKYLSRYLTASSAKTCVVEEEYIDKDYFIDYSNFYARSFKDHNKFTTRLHFFSKIFSNEYFRNILVEGDVDASKKLNASYLGFVVIKPIKDSNGQPLVGRTILETYTDDINEDEHRVYIKENYHSSLFGIPLTIKSLPFQTQDTAVGACATTACWIILHSLTALFGVQKDAPFEITEKSASLSSMDGRNFPNSGLSLLQMKSYFNSIELETELIDVEEFKKLNDYSQEDDDVVADVIKAYINMNLPVIAALELIKDDQVAGFHAAVISGYRHKNGLLNEMYVHDDRIGPYTRTMPHKNFIHWKNEWIDERGFTDVRVSKLMVPIYPKIRLNFSSVYQLYLKCKGSLRSHPEEFGLNLFLCDSKEYKKKLCRDFSFDNKESILSKPFPRFVWIIRLDLCGTPRVDIIYDGTSVYPNEKVINFKDTSS